MDKKSESGEKEKAAPILETKLVNLNDQIGFELEAKQFSVFAAILRVFLRVFCLFVCVAACCILLCLEEMTVAGLIRILYVEELQAVENEEGNVNLKNFTLILWVFALYSLFGEMIKILVLNEKIRILEAVRHRSKMESILSLIRHKSYFDADAVDFILRNQSNSLIDTVLDEMEAESIVHHRVHGMDPHRKFDQRKD